MLPPSPGAERYAQLRPRLRIQERALFAPVRAPSELELQARWFAGDFGREFRSSCGKAVEIVQFGVWNREAGPDFQEAAIRIDGAEVRSGSVEFDLADRNWETHGHSSNPAFEETVLHVFVQRSEHTFFTRTLRHRNVLQVQADPAVLPDVFSASVPLARPGRCQAPLQGLESERVESVIEAAARFRLQQKAARLRAGIDAHGVDQALFHELAAALGYKQNKLPFTLIAQRLPLAAFRAQKESAEAFLFGVAGLLDAPDLSVYRSDTRSYVRGLWDRWWPQRNELERLVLPREIWRFGSARPMNHPQRRLGALAALAKDWIGWKHSLGEAGAAREFLLSLRHPYWNHHYTLTSEASAKEMALIGESRAAEILANVVFPVFLSQGIEVWADYRWLTAKLTNRRLETAITRLFGNDPRRAAFVKTVAHQQGLLQIYQDFCLQDNSDCAACPFPEQMRKWT